MKKFLSLLFLLTVLFSPATAAAGSPQTSLSGPDTVQPGDTVTLTFSLTGSGIYGVSGTVSYDSNQLTLTGASQVIGGDWAVEFHEGSFLAYDNALETPINGSTALFAVTFDVSSNLEPGTAVSIACTDVITSDGFSDTDCGTVHYSTVVAARPAQQVQPPVETAASVPQPTQTTPAAVSTDPIEPETQPTETVPTTAAPAEPAEPEEPQVHSGIPVGVLILTAMVCLAAGACVGIVLDQKLFRKNNP